MSLKEVVHLLILQRKPGFLILCIIFHISRALIPLWLLLLLGSVHLGYSFLRLLLFLICSKVRFGSQYPRFHRLRERLAGLFREDGGESPRERRDHEGLGPDGQILERVFLSTLQVEKVVMGQTGIAALANTLEVVSCRRS